MTTREGLTFVLTCVASVAFIGAMGDCGSRPDTATGPSEAPTPAATAPAGSTTTPPAEGGAPAVPSDGDDRADGIHVSDNGTIEITIDDPLRACLYEGAYGAGKLVPGGDWSLGVGTNKRPNRLAWVWENDTCFPKQYQLDVVGDAACPPTPNFSDYRDGLVIDVKAGKTGEECEECVEDPKKIDVTVCDPFPSCSEGSCESVTRQCVETTGTDYRCKDDEVFVKRYPETKECPCECVWQGEFCSTYLSNSGDDYYTTDDGERWLRDLDLRSGRREYCWPHAVDGSRLCLKWRHETIGCCTLSEGEYASGKWHGDVECRKECVYPEAND